MPFVAEYYLMEQDLYETKVALESDNIRLSMPLFKVDRERRVVHGFATLDNLDRQDDIVTKAASINAFERFRGNIREQHDPTKAVGRVVSFKEDSVVDQESLKVYNGIFVSAYVSKGAEDTWQKVLDGTLSGFSIGGAVKRKENAFDEDLNKTITIIHDYDLTELSLVDAPANELANVISIEKRDGKTTMTTPLVKGGIENIFWCKTDSLVSLKSDDSERCAVCDREMANVGFVETNDPDKRTTIKSSLETFKKSTMTGEPVVDQIVKEASKVAEDTITEEATTEEVAKSDEVVEESAPEVEAEVEKADEAKVEAEVEEVEKSDAPEVEAEVVKTDAAAEKVDEITTLLASSLSTLADAVKSLNEKIDEVAKSVSGVQKDVEATKENSESLGKRVEKVEDNTAFRKSGDVGDVVQEQVIQKADSLWGGRFLNSTDL